MNAGPGAAGAIAEAATLLAAARLAAAQVPALPPSLAPATATVGYAVQKDLARRLADAGQGSLAGWKVGATTPGMQAYLGVDGPACGRILSANVHASDATLSPAGFCNPGIECEIAFRIARSSAGQPAQRLWTRESAANLVAAALPAIEIVENRYGDFLARGMPTLIADDFFHKACVLGKETDAWQAVDLAEVRGRTLVDGAERGAGRGADVMGHPLEALAWLANMLESLGTELQPDQVVLTGSLAPVIWIEAFPATAEIVLDGLGSVGVRFG